MPNKYDPNWDSGEFDKWYKEVMKQEEERAKTPCAGFVRGCTSPKLPMTDSMREFLNLPRLIGRPKRKEVISQEDIERIKKIDDPRMIQFF